MYDAAYIICTEVVNQWLGDLVTASWWDDLWLTMAFGDYFSIIGIDNVSKQLSNSLWKTMI